MVIVKIDIKYRKRKKNAIKDSYEKESGYPAFD
jgi:hypothetical protein